MLSALTLRLARVPLIVIEDEPLEPLTTDTPEREPSDTVPGPLATEPTLISAESEVPEALMSDRAKASGAKVYELLFNTVAVTPTVVVSGVPTNGGTIKVIETAAEPLRLSLELASVSCRVSLPTR